MQKITYSDFSGGQNEVYFPSEFSPGQWHSLIGVVANEDGLVETQPAIQRIGSFPAGDHFFKIHSIVTSVGTFIVAITRLGRLYWCKAPAADAVYTTSNAVTWTQITTAENYAWTSAGYPSKETITDNPYFRFICEVPVKSYQYARTPSATAPQDTSKDTDVSSEVGQFPGVLISYRTKEKSTVATPQVLVAYVNTKDSTPTVKALLFPNQRRIPTFTTEEIDGTEHNDFINAVFTNTSNRLDYATMPEWPFSMQSVNPEVKMHPFAYSNVDGANLSGTGIIPRATVGCSIENKLILGDIEWRIDTKDLPTVPTNLQAIGSVGATPTILPWPSNVEPNGRVIRNEGPSTLYLAENADGLAASAPTSTGTSVKVLRARKTASPSPHTCHITLDAIPPAGATSITVSGVGPTYNGTFAVFTVAGQTVSYVNVKDPATVAEAKRKGKVVFKDAGQGYNIEIEPKGYASVPNSWEYIAAVSDSTSEAFAYRDRLLARHFLNDSNTGRVPNGIYFSIAEMDQFNPTAMFEVSRGGSPIAGLHTIDNTVIAITEGGGEVDGVYRVRGNFTLQAAGDPTALRVELIKSGVGSPNMVEDIKNPPRRSCLWPDASTVIFVDRMGGVFFTDGNVCDRLDRLGPVTLPNINYASVAAVGKHLFMVRGTSTEGLDKLYCFTITRSDGSAASGVWTQMSLARGYYSAYASPVGVDPTLTAGSEVYLRVDNAENNTRTVTYSDPPLLPFNLISGRDDLYFIGIDGADGQPTYAANTYHSSRTGASGGHVYRVALSGPLAERGTIDNVPVVQIITSPTVSGQDQNDVTNWFQAGITFATKEFVNIRAFWTVARGGGFIHGLGPSAIGSVVKDYHGKPLSNTPGDIYTGTIYYDQAKLLEVVGSAGIGPQPLISATILYNGHMILNSLSFWTTGRAPDKGRS